jgi:hypothetical protein
MTLSQLAAKANVSFAPPAATVFSQAKEENPNLDLNSLSPEDKSLLDSWFKRYYGMQVTQVANLRSTLNSPVKHLALDLVSLVNPEVRERAGLSAWFDKPKTKA